MNDFMKQEKAIKLFLSFPQACQVHVVQRCGMYGIFPCELLMKLSKTLHDNPVKIVEYLNTKNTSNLEEEEFPCNGSRLMTVDTDRVALAPLEGQRVLLTAFFKEISSHLGGSAKVSDALFTGVEIRLLNPEVVIAYTQAIKADHIWARVPLTEGRALMRRGFCRQVTLAGTVYRYQRNDGSVSWSVELEESVNLDELMAELSMSLRRSDSADRKAAIRTTYKHLFDLMDQAIPVFSLIRPTKRVLAGIRAEWTDLSSRASKTSASYRPCPIKPKKEKSLIPSWH